jgi:hypothetical protein
MRNPAQLLGGVVELLGGGGSGSGGESERWLDLRMFLLPWQGPLRHSRAVGDGSGARDREEVEEGTERRWRWR